MDEALGTGFRLMRIVACTFTKAALAWVLLCGLGHAGDVKSPSFAVRAEPVFKQLSPKYCWFHPRVAPLPGYGKDGQPAVIMTIQKHLAADDHYSGLYFLRTNDLGKTWSGPTEIPELAWRQGENNETIAVCDVTPGWHAKSGKLIAIGIKLRYSQQGAQLLDKPRSHECAYATYDPKTDTWTSWKMLAMPETDGKFFLVAPGCVQWLEQADGTLLVPIYFKGPTGSDYQVTVLHCAFDGTEMRFLKHGDELAIKGGRGFCEPSLAFFKGRYFLTLRNDARAYVTTSKDGLHFEPVKPWTFDDGKDLGSYNTQAHWLTHSGGLFLSYTRRGANNDHIPRNRAPIFVAQVDPDKLHVVRKTEKALLPERGVMLGNFGAAAITPQESWVTDAEFIVSDKAHPRGADGAVWLGRVKWGVTQERTPHRTSQDVFSRSNLVAWCIVPFDAKNRNPAQRAEMVKRLGLSRVAYDWRENHVAGFEEEILQYKTHGIEYFAFWGTHEKAFELFAKHDLRPQIWQTAPSPEGATSEVRVAAAVKQLLPLVQRTSTMKCQLGLYNHGGWGGEPDNLVAVCKTLRAQHKADHVGIVYNLHHGHGHIADFEKALAAMQPYLLCLNLNGMTTDGDKKAKKILPLGAGEHDLAVLKIIRDSNYRGPIGIIGHTNDDVAQRLQDNLDGLDWLLPQLSGKQPGPRSKYRTYR